MASPIEIVTISISVIVPTVTIVVTIMLSRISARNRKIEVLQAKLELRDEQVMDLKILNSELKVTGQTVNRFFSQLPANTGDLRKEIGT